MSKPQEKQDEALRKIEEMEARNASLARYEFIGFEALSDAAGIDRTELREILESLKQRHLIIWDKTAGVRSRTGHILFSLLNSEARSRTQAPLRNVSDLKYIRYVKQIPRYVVDLSDPATRANLDEILGFSEVERESGAVVSTALTAIAGRFPRISQFQFRSTLQILQMIANPGPESNLVLVADTGGGKSFAYQLPMMLWILAKKMRAYLLGQKRVSCSALLVFPRNVLAQDQLDEVTSLAQTIQRQIDGLSLPSDFRDFLAFRIKKDFGQPSREEVAASYRGRPDIIVTNTEALKRRLMNPVPHQVYRDGIELVLYDEVHLYHGLHGAFVAGLNARLKAVLPNVPVFVGMSATIARPEKHCQRLFALQARPRLVSDRDDILQKWVVEHHVILKPRAGRPPLGVAIDATSCLLHNRRDGIASIRNTAPDDRPKTICFSDSLDTTGRWTRDQNNLEFLEPRAIPPQDFFRGYPFYWRPASRPNSKPSFEQACAACHEGKDTFCSFCEHYQAGRCWWFSQDSGIAGSWVRVGGSSFGNLHIPNDNIRSRRLTAQEVESWRGGSIYDLYRAELFHFIGRNRVRLDTVDADNLIATSVLEVGVDFRGVKEIIMFGEIQSPATYKQKSGRGAREGNTTDGLFVMTIVPQMPLANFYYRHFWRLVNPTLTPVPLEPSNPDSLKSHAFASVLDYLAKRGVNIFNIIEIKEDQAGIEEEFERALNLLRHERMGVEQHVREYLLKTGTTDEDIVGKAVDEAEKLLIDLSEHVELEDTRRKFVSWIFMGSRDPHILRSLHEKILEEYENQKGYVQSVAGIKKEFSEAKEKLERILRELGGTYEPIIAELELSRWECE
jgi:hypothetical protein